MGWFSSAKKDGTLSKRRREEMVDIKRENGTLLTFEDELTKLINQYSLESLSNTPDFILAYYLKDCLHSYNNAQQRRAEWFRQRAASAETARASQVAEL